MRDSRCACHSRALKEFLLVWWLGASHCVVSPFDSSGRVSRRGCFGVTISGDRGPLIAARGVARARAVRWAYRLLAAARRLSLAMCRWDAEPPCRSGVVCVLSSDVVVLERWRVWASPGWWAMTLSFRCQ